MVINLALHQRYEYHFTIIDFIFQSAIYEHNTFKSTFRWKNYNNSFNNKKIQLWLKSKDTVSRKTKQQQISLIFYLFI